MTFISKQLVRYGLASAITPYASQRGARTFKENRKLPTGSTRGTTGTRLVHLLFHFHQRGPKLRLFRHKFTRDADALGLGNFRKSRAVLVSEPLKEALPSGLVAGEKLEPEGHPRSGRRQAEPERRGPCR